MKITFLGGVGTVTGSMYLVETNRQRILLECGLYQGKRNESYKRNRNFPMDVNRVDSMVLSHAHIDHSGNIPNLVKQGFNGPIYATHATRSLCGAMLPDSGRIHEHDVQYVNKKRAKKSEPFMEPLYTEADALHSMSSFVGMGYDRPFEIARGVTITFMDAGHILGSAMVLLEAKEDGDTKRLLFSGDLGQPDLPIVRDPTPLPKADVVMMESTYGNRLHPPIAHIQDQLEEIVNKVVRRGGRIVIPAFAVGRTQEIVYDLHQLAVANRIPEIPIYVDSPLAVNVTEIFRLHADCYDQETRDFLESSGSFDPFGFYRMHYVRNVRESKDLNDRTDPIIIISASGMAEAGRIQHHLLHSVEESRNAILITGWQAPYTLGRRIAEGSEIVRIFGDEYHLRAKVHTLYGYSAHADRDDLLNWAAPRAETVKHAFVVHGERESAQVLAEGLRGLGFDKVTVPERRETFTV